MHVRLQGIYTIRSPLSHIGEAISTHSYLVQEPILQDSGEVEEVFVYNGNALRGMIRDLAASYMLDNLEFKIPLEAFHLLFSGGRIGGEQKIDLDQARAMRKAIPMLSLMGGGVGNQILPGKTRFSNLYPLCREALPALPESFCNDATRLSYRQMTTEKSFSRKDDAKDDRLKPYLDTPESLLLPGEKKKKDGPADQMRMTAELVIVGVRLYSEIECIDVTDVELGCLVSALHYFSRSPHLGGQSNRGHGRVAVDYNLLDLDTGESQSFLKITDGPALLARPAEEAKAAYDQHLKDIYTQMIGEAKPEIKQLLKAV